MTRRGGVQTLGLCRNQKCCQGNAGYADAGRVIRQARFEATSSNRGDRSRKAACRALNPRGSREEAGDVHWAIHSNQCQEAADGDSQPKPSSRRHAAKGVPTPKNH
jgi:hypothetical protein